MANVCGKEVYSSKTCQAHQSTYGSLTKPYKKTVKHTDSLDVDVQEHWRKFLRPELVNVLKSTLLDSQHSVKLWLNSRRKHQCIEMVDLAGCPFQAPEEKCAPGALSSYCFALSALFACPAHRISQHT